MHSLKLEENIIVRELEPIGYYISSSTKCTGITLLQEEAAVSP
jgi:hypothetical protein